MNMEDQIVDKKYPAYLIPLRYAFRFISRYIFTRPRIFQVRIDNIDCLVWAHEYIGKRLILTREFEAAEIAFLKKVIGKNFVCVDVGGNTGLYSLQLAKLASEGMVHTFEPVAHNYHVIQLAKHINSFNNLTVNNMAVGAEPGVVRMAVPLNDSGYAYMTSEGRGNVCVVRLDEYFSESSLERVDFLKIDVEGAEYEVIKGGSEIFGDADKKPLVVQVELIDRYLERFGASVDKFIATMAGYGYEKYVLRSGFLSEPAASDASEQNFFFLDRTRLDSVATLLKSA